MMPDPSQTLAGYRRLRHAVLLVLVLILLLLGGFTAWRSVQDYRLSLRSAAMQTRGYVSALQELAERTLSEADATLDDFPVVATANMGSEEVTSLGANTPGC